MRRSGNTDHTDASRVSTRGFSRIVERRSAYHPDEFLHEIVPPPPLFGLTADEVGAWKARKYVPREIYESNPELRDAIDLIGSGMFSDGERDLFRPIVESLLNRDDYMLLADYQPYVEAQQRVSEAYRDRPNWTRMSILNTARVGRFSSDRSIREYCRHIWHIGEVAPGRRAEPGRAGGRGGRGLPAVPAVITVRNRGGFGPVGR